MQATASEQQTRRALWALIALAVLPTFLALSNETWEGDPSQYAEVSRRMVRTGDWLHLNDTFGPFLNKPPLALWSMAAFIKVLGPTSEAIRIPAFLFGVLLLVAVARIGALLWSREVGLSAAALLASSLSFQLLVGDPKVDGAVTAMTACTLWMALEARRRPWMMWLAWLFAGLGLLSKGPIGLVAPAVAVLPEALRHRWGDAERGSFFSRLWRLQPLGLLLAIAVVLPFVKALHEQFGPAGPRFFLIGQSFDRVLHRSEWKDATTALFFLHTALWAFAPFIPALGVAVARGLKALARTRSLPWDEARLLWWWLLIPFVAISLSSYKLPQYLFWLAPPAALLSARALADGVPPALAWVFRFLAGVGVLGVALIGTVAFPPSSALVTFTWVAFAAAVAVLASLAARRIGGLAGWTALTVGALLALDTFHQTYLYPALMRFQPGEELGALVRKEDPEAKALAFVGLRASEATAYYADRVAIQLNPSELAEKVRAGEVRVAVLDPQVVAEVEGQGLKVERLKALPYFPTSIPTRAFLLEKTRPSVVTEQLLVKVSVYR